MNHSQPFCPPDLSTRPFHFTVDRVMNASLSVLYRAWTEQFDRWFATLGTLLRKGESMSKYESKHSSNKRRS